MQQPPNNTITAKNPPLREDSDSARRRRIPLFGEQRSQSQLGIDLISNCPMEQRAYRPKLNLKNFQGGNRKVGDVQLSALNSVPQTANRSLMQSTNCEQKQAMEEKIAYQQNRHRISHILPQQNRINQIIDQCRSKSVISEIQQENNKKDKQQQSIAQSPQMPSLNKNLQKKLNKLQGSDQQQGLSPSQKSQNSDERDHLVQGTSAKELRKTHFGESSQEIEGQNVKEGYDAMITNNAQQSRALSDLKIAEPVLQNRTVVTKKPWLRGTQYSNFQSTHQLPNYLQNQTTKSFVDQALTYKFPESKSALDSFKSLDKDKKLPKTKEDYLFLYQQKNVFDLNKTMIQNATNTQNSVKRSSRENYVDLRYGVSRDWPRTHLNESSLRTSKNASYIDTYTRENLEKSYMRQRNESAIDILPSDLTNFQYHSDEPPKDVEGGQKQTEEHHIYNTLTDTMHTVKKEINNKKEDDFHDQFIKILGATSEKEYRTAGQQQQQQQEKQEKQEKQEEDCERVKDMKRYQSLFNKKKGYAQYMVDVYRIHSKEHLMKHLRDGNNYIKKNKYAYQDKEHMADPSLRCDRHDRHVQLPFERNIPQPIIFTTTRENFRPNSELKPSSTQESLNAQIQKEMLDAAYAQGMNQIYVDQLAMSSRNGSERASSGRSNSPMRFNSQVYENQFITTKQFNKVPTESSIGTIMDSTIQNSEMGKTDEYVFKENNEVATGSPRTTERLLHQLSQFDVANPNTISAEHDSKSRVKNISVMKLLNNGLHSDQKQQDSSKDSLLINMKNFQKYFKKQNDSIKNQNKTHNSPYFKYINPYRHAIDVLNSNVNGQGANRSLDSSRFDKSQQLANTSANIKTMNSQSQNQQTDYLENNRPQGINFIDQSSWPDQSQFRPSSRQQHLGGNRHVTHYSISPNGSRLTTNNEHNMSQMKPYALETGQLQQTVLRGDRIKQASLTSHLSRKDQYSTDIYSQSTANPFGFTGNVTQNVAPSNTLVKEVPKLKLANLRSPIIQQNQRTHRSLSKSKRSISNNDEQTKRNKFESYKLQKQLRDTAAKQRILKGQNQQPSPLNQALQANQQSTMAESTIRGEQQSASSAVFQGVSAVKFSRMGKFEREIALNKLNEEQRTNASKQLGGVQAKLAKQQPSLMLTDRLASIGSIASLSQSKKANFGMKYNQSQIMDNELNIRRKTAEKFDFKNTVMLGKHTPYYQETKDATTTANNTFTKMHSEAITPFGIKNGRNVQLRPKFMNNEHRKQLLKNYNEQIGHGNLKYDIAKRGGHIYDDIVQRAQTTETQNNFSKENRDNKEINYVSIENQRGVSFSQRQDRPPLPHPKKIDLKNLTEETQTLRQQDSLPLLTQENNLGLTQVSTLAALKPPAAAAAASNAPHNH